MPKGIAKNPAERSRKISQALTGLKRSLETRQKMSHAQLARNRKKDRTCPVCQINQIKGWKALQCGECARKSWVPWNKGKTGYSTSQKGVKRPLQSGENCTAKRPEVREKNRQAKLGNKFGVGKRSDAFRRRLSEVALERVANGTHNFWKGGTTAQKQKIRKGVEWKLWREAVFKRDDWTCVWCNQRGGVLEPDHIKPFALFPELRFVVENGRTLCQKCHRTTDTYGNTTSESRRKSSERMTLNNPMKKQVEIHGPTSLEIIK